MFKSSKTTEKSTLKNQFHQAISTNQNRFPISSKNKENTKTGQILKVPESQTNSINKNSIKSIDSTQKITKPITKIQTKLPPKSPDFENLKKPFKITNRDFSNVTANDLKKLLDEMMTQESVKINELQEILDKKKQANDKWKLITSKNFSKE